MADQALSDLKVLELGDYVTAAYCGKMLADYGAEVIKIERPGTGDVSRRMGPFPNDIPDPEKSGLFLHLNTTKKGTTLDITTRTGQKLFKELVREADVVVENFPPGVMSSLGLGYQDLEKIKPSLIMTSITPFGQTGPHRDYKAEEIVSFAMCGYMLWEGWPEREPMKFAGRQSLYFAGSTAAAATLTALTGLWLHGIGQHVDASIQEATSLLGNTRISMWAYSRDYGNPRGGEGGGFPRGIYFCKDGVVLVIGMGVRYWPRLVQMLEMPELLDDPRFQTVQQRHVDNRDELAAIVLPWLLDRTRQEIIEKGQAARVMAIPINSVDTLMDDPQQKFRGAFVEIEHPKVGKLLYAGAPFRMPETPWRAGRAPLLGEHNEEVYCGRLGYTKEDLVLLRERGII